jgi:hypothetical protein
VFKKINKQLHALTQLELQYVAPALVRAQVRGLCARLAAEGYGAAAAAGLGRTRTLEVVMYTATRLPWRLQRRLVRRWTIGFTALC